MAKKASKFKKIAILLAVIAAVVVGVKKFLFPSGEALSAFDWKVNGTTYSGKGLNIQKIGFNEYRIGDGYTGKYWMGKITTTARNGVPESKLTWEMLK